MYKVETHLHTKDSSGCGWIHGADQAILYKSEGYDTIFVTDHFDAGFIDYYKMPWDEKIERFMLGYREAKRKGDEIGLNVIFGAEVMFRSSPNHYLVYGLTKEFLLNHPDLIDRDVEYLHQETQKYGMILVQAHPFRGACRPRPDAVDGMETRNLNPRHFVATDEANTVALVEKYRLLHTSGSDAHRPEDIGAGGILSPHPITSASSFIDLLKSGNGTLL